MKKALAGVATTLLLGGLVAPAYAQQTPSPAALTAAAPACQFVLGFKTLHDLDPADIGDCVDNQATVSNGDAQQHTTKGLMVWRKADNWTAFTNGNMTWINGPNGLQSRLNTARFPWEQGGAPASGSPVASPAPAATPTPDTSQGVPAGPTITTSGPDDSQPLGDAPAGGFVPIPLPSGCSVTLTETPRFDATTKTVAQPNGKTYMDIQPHLTCNGQDTAISTLPQSTLDAACTDVISKYGAQTQQEGFILTAKDYLCPRLNDPSFLS